MAGSAFRQSSSYTLRRTMSHPACASSRICGKRGRSVPAVRIGHALHAHRRAAANGHFSNEKRTGSAHAKTAFQTQNIHHSMKGTAYRQAGRSASRVRSTEDEHAAQRQRSPKPATPPTGGGAGRIKGCAAPRVEDTAQRQRSPKPATCSGAGRIKGCEAPRVEDTAQRYREPEARNSPAGGGAGRIERVRSTEDEHAAQRQRSPKPATRSGAGRIKGAKHRGLRTPRSGTANPKPATPPQGVERAASKGAKHRGRARRTAAAQSEARNSPHRGWSGP